MLDFNAASRRPCILCGRPPRFAGVFIAKDQRRVGAPPGKLRGVAYTLCKKCSRKPGATHQAGERILADCDALAQVN